MNKPTPQSAQWMADAAKEPRDMTDENLIAWSQAKRGKAPLGKGHSEIIVEMEKRIARSESAGSDLSTRVRALEQALAHNRAVLGYCRAMLIMCRDHFAEGDAMHSWAAECLQTVLKIDHQEKTNAALSPGRLAG